MRDCATSLQSELAEDELELLLLTLREKAPKGNVLEIGTAAGGTLWQMIKALRDVVESPKMVVLDPMNYFPRQNDIVKENLLEHGIDSSRVDFRVKYSGEAYEIAQSKQEKFDLIFIDGNHKCRYVMQDLHWLSLLEVKGIVAFHDYGFAHKGVKKAVDIFLKKNKNYVRKAHVRELLIIEKIAPSHFQEVSSLDHCSAYLYTHLYQLERSIRKRLRAS
jgi:predicted O-methyltransferase YrrM